MNKLLLIFIFLTVFRDCYFQSDNQQELIYRELGYAEPNNNLKSKYELDYNKFQKPSQISAQVRKEISSISLQPYLSKYFDVDLENQNFDGEYFHYNWEYFSKNYNWKYFLKHFYQDQTNMRKHWEQFFNTLYPYSLIEPRIPNNKSCIQHEYEHYKKTIPKCGQKFGDIFKDQQSPKPKTILDAMILGFDSDVLEIRFQGLDAVVDNYVLLESTITSSAVKKLLVWSKLKNNPRFRRYNRKVLHFIQNDLVIMEDLHFEYNFYTQQVYNSDVWIHENTQRKRLQQKIYSLYKMGFFDIEDIVIAGDTDEIPKPETVSNLKYCQLKDATLHKQGTIFFYMSQYGNAYHCYDPESPYYPFTYARPTFLNIKKLDSLPDHNQGLFNLITPGQHLQGGTHLTAFPYAPHIILKAFGIGEQNMNDYWQLEYIIKKTDIYKLVYSYWDIFHSRIQANYTNPESKYSEIFYIPYSLTCNKQRYPAWYWQEDERQIINPDPKVVQANNEYKKALEKSNKQVKDDLSFYDIKFLPKDNKYNLYQAIRNIDWNYYIDLLSSQQLDVKQKHHTISTLLDVVGAYLDLDPTFPFNMACLNNHYLAYDNQSTIEFESYPLINGLLLDQKRDQPAQILDISYMNYELDQYELKIYELYPIVDIFGLLENVLTESGIRKPLIWSRSKNNYRFVQFAQKLFYLGLDDYTMLHDIIPKQKNNYNDIFDNYVYMDEETRKNLKNKYWQFSMNHLKSIMSHGKFLKPDDLIIMSSASYIPHVELLQKLKYYKIKPEYNSKFIIQTKDLKIMNVQTFLNIQIKNFIDVDHQFDEILSSQLNLGRDLSSYGFWPYKFMSQISKLNFDMNSETFNEFLNLKEYRLNEQELKQNRDMELMMCNKFRYPAFYNEMDHRIRK